VHHPDNESASRRLTLAGNSRRPVWTPDGRFVTFTSDREGTWSIWQRRADGSGVAEQLTTAADGEEHWPTSWSPDGRTLAFTVVQDGDVGTAAIWTLSLDSGEVERFYDVPDSPEDGAVFSAEGNWLAYWSRENGTDNQVWVQPFPARGGADKRQLTFEGGTYPVWSPDGRRLVYRRTFGSTSRPRLFEIDVDAGNTFGFSNERELPFEGFLIFNFSRDYDFAPDGRLLMVFPAEPGATEEAARQQIVITQNWHEELRRRVPPD
jgi:Tol biopolymer transport system component